ncbi:3-deoxy-8-phosphooctulonate synthase [candidate division KSB1 bacterium]|nr:MAG: 3-deoxy-8-phosphooctulonate synthase [candidate division KSB1 bacterium]
MYTIKLDSMKIGGGNPLVLIAGPCVIEEEDLVLSTAEKIKGITSKFDMPFIFKSSFLKDNRSSSSSYQGPGLEKGLKILEKVKKETGVPVLSDVHYQSQVKAAAEVLDVIQIPAYLSMQTSLTVAAARTGKVINVKKGQFLHPEDVKNIIGKIEAEGNKNIILTERGACFGYRNLVVDMRSFQIMRSFGYPVVFDPTHSIRIYGISSSDSRGGAPHFVPGLSRAAVAAGIDVIFIETHPDCKNALCDAASMWPLDLLEPLLRQLVEIDKLRRSQEDVFIKI